MEHESAFINAQPEGNQAEVVYTTLASQFPNFWMFLGVFNVDFVYKLIGSSCTHTHTEIHANR